MTKIQETAASVSCEKIAAADDRISRVFLFPRGFRRLIGRQILASLFFLYLFFTPPLLREPPHPLGLGIGEVVRLGAIFRKIVQFPGRPRSRRDDFPIADAQRAILL